MANRTVYYVVPFGNVGWAIKKEGNSEPIAIYSSKDTAVAIAVSMAKNNKPSQVKILGMDGKIQTEYTYGDDPYPPPG
ncbi:MAG: DUF2188 domain-containing protein [Planctomycetota bacterium]